MDTMRSLCNSVENLAKTTIWLGDMLDTKEVIRGKCLNFWLKYFSSSPLTHIIIVGNHDWFNLECEDHALRSLHNLENVLIVDSITELAPGCHAIPYIHDQAELKKILSSLPKDTVLFAHLEVSQFDFGNGRICESGLTLNDLRKFKRVISGHFHKYQNKDNLTYLGTPFSHSFGESNQEKFLGSYSIEQDKLDLVPTGLPQHTTIEFDCDYSYQQSGDDMQHAFTLDMAKAPQNFYRILLKGTQENIDRFPKDMYLKNPDCKLNIKFIERASDSPMHNVEIDDTVDNKAQFHKWASEIQQLDSETVELGLQILGDVDGK